MKGRERTHRANAVHSKAAAATLRSDHTDVRTKMLTGDRDGRFIVTTGTVQQDDIVLSMSEGCPGKSSHECLCFPYDRAGYFPEGPRTCQDCVPLLGGWTGIPDTHCCHLGPGAPELRPGRGPADRAVLSTHSRTPAHQDREREGSSPKRTNVRTRRATCFSPESDTPVASLMSPVSAPARVQGRGALPPRQSFWIKTGAS